MVKIILNNIIYSIPQMINYKDLNVIQNKVKNDIIQAILGLDLKKKQI